MTELLRLPRPHAAPVRALPLGVTLVTLAILAGCASGPRSSGRDGAEASPPSNLNSVANAQPRVETIRSSGGTSKPYTVLGRSYVPITEDRPLRERGLASWYGRKFHNQSTASGEPYDMYAMTAAHKTMPLPSYARVRNPANQREIIVRVNDRGPFHADRVIDLSYTAALQLDLLRGVAPVEIERITNEEIRAGAWQRGTPNETQLAQPASAPVTPQPVAAAPVYVAATTMPPAAPVVDVVDAQPTPRTAVVDDAPRLRVTELPPLAPLGAPAASPSGTATANDAGVAASVPAGFWVQLGAFSQREGAASFQSRVGQHMPVLAPRMVVVSENGMHRLQTGPFTSRESAQQIGEQVRSAIGVAPLVVERH